MRPHLIALSCACLASLSGCSKQPATPPDAGSGCAVDDDCKSADKRCVGGACVATSCGDHPCHASQGCVSGECRAEDCATVSCPQGQGCALGNCLPLACGATTCAPGDVCVSDHCTFAGCAAKTCAANALCADGRCLPKACASATCADGAACDGDHCAALPCIGLTCPTGTSCAQGRCAAPGCGDAGACPAGQACLDGACVVPTCFGLSCPAGTRCQAASCVTCPNSEASCYDGVDDDCDGLTDCADPDCDGADCAANGTKTCKAGVCADEPCGNGKVETGEECDDGNRKDGDGCSAKCQKECGWTCTGEPSYCDADDFLDLTASIASVVGAGAGVQALAVADDGLYVGADGGKLLHLDRKCTATDLTAKISSFWQTASVISLAWDAKARVLYAGGDAYGRFARYNPAGWKGTDANYPDADKAWDLTGKHALSTKVWQVEQLLADPAGGAIYLAVNDLSGCGVKATPSYLVRYRPDADVCDKGLNSCANRCVDPPNSCAVDVMAFDPTARALWSAGRDVGPTTGWTGIDKLDLGSGSFQKCLSTTLTANWPTALAWDPKASALYLTGKVYDSAGGDFVRWEPATATKTLLTSKLETAWQQPNAGDLNNMYALALDPESKVVWVGGQFGKLARYGTPDNPDHPDTASLYSLGATTWGTATVRALAWDPSGFVWVAGESGKLARLRARP